MYLRFRGNRAGGPGLVRVDSLYRAPKGLGHKILSEPPIRLDGTIPTSPTGEHYEDNHRINTAHLRRLAVACMRQGEASHSSPDSCRRTRNAAGNQPNHPHLKLRERLHLACSSRLRLGEIASQPRQAKDEGLPIERLAGRNIERLAGRNTHKQLKNKEIDNPPIESAWRKAKGLSKSEATAPPR
jgi:hypothetical protein